MPIAMDDARKVYVNTLAEGACIGEEELTEQNIDFAARLWRNNKSVIHVKLIGTRKIQTGDISKEVLFGDIGVATVYLPLEKAGLTPNQEPRTLTRHRVAVTVDEFDMRDEGNRAIFVNRETALEKLKQINEHRLKQDETVHGVVQRVIPGGYIMNVGGELAYLPRYYYDWDRTKTANVGDEFEVKILPPRQNRRQARLVANVVPENRQVGKTLGEIKAVQEAALRNEFATVDSVSEEKATVIALETSLSTEEPTTKDTGSVTGVENDHAPDSEVVDETQKEEPMATNESSKPDTPVAGRRRYIVVSRIATISNPFANMHLEPGSTVTGRISGFTRSGRVLVEISKNAFVAAGGFYTTHRIPPVGALAEVRISHFRPQNGNVIGTVMRVVDDSTARLIERRR